MAVKQVRLADLPKTELRVIMVSSQGVDFVITLHANVSVSLKLTSSKILMYRLPQLNTKTEVCLY